MHPLALEKQRFLMEKGGLRGISFQSVLGNPDAASADFELRAFWISMAILAVSMWVMLLSLLTQKE